MAISCNKFYSSLKASGLLVDDVLRAAAEELQKNPSIENGRDMGRELVRHKFLTAFQATAIYQGKVRGLLFGEYVVLDKLAAGGMGRVFKAMHRRMQRTVALKVLPKEALSSTQAVERFHREVRAAAQLLHPNIVASYDAGEHHGIHFLVMEYIDGDDLARLIRRNGPFPVATALDYIRQAALGLDYAHGKGIIHRDVKPSNLLLNPEDVVKVLDMGLARYEDQTDPSSEEITRVGQVIGTIDYMAPEQAEDIELADARSDIYGLGCTFCRLVTGRPPYRGSTLLKKLLAHREAPIPHLADKCPAVTDAVEEVFQRMVAKRPEERFATAGELARELQGLTLSYDVQTALADVYAGPAAEKHSRPRTADADAESPESEVSDFLRVLAGDEDPSSSSVHEPTPAPSRSDSGRRTARRMRGHESLWVRIFFFLFVLLLMTPLLVFIWSLTRKGVVVLEWNPRDSRGDVRMEIDDRPVRIPTSGEMRFEIQPGQHDIMLMRHGYEANRWKVDLERGEELKLAPNWVPRPNAGVRP